MSGTHYIPRKDTDFASWAGVFAAYLEPNRQRFGIPDTAVNGVMTAFEVWKIKYAMAEATATRTSPAVHEKNEARMVLETLVRRFNNEYLAYNSLVTDTDRAAMGLHVAKRGRTKHAAPSTMPEFRVDTSVIRRLTVHFRDLGSTSRAKPPGVHGVEIKWCFADGVPETLDELINSSFDTRSPHTLEFTENQRGKTVRLCLRWQNTRGEKGPWSEIKGAVIP